MVRSFLFVISLFVFTIFGLRIVPADAATQFTSLYSFSPVSSSPTMNADGARPYAGLVEGDDGDFYGVAPYAGPNNAGTLFKITSAGALTVLAAFNGTNGANPSANLVLSSDGNFYGSTQHGGAYGNGTLFKLTPSGTLTTLYNFSAVDSHGFNNDGSQPEAALLSVGHGYFFGTTIDGGTDGEGTIFRFVTDGTAHGTMLTPLVSFTDTSGPDLGAYPYGSLILGSDGLYGTTSQGGVNDTGTVYRVTTDGVLTTVYNFSAVTGGKNADGNRPVCTLTQSSGGVLYGTTNQGGPNADGTVFSITQNGVLTTLVAFDGTNGAAPNAGVAAGADGNFYGTTSIGGTNDTGTIYAVTPSGTLTTLHDFSAVTTSYPYKNADGGYPLAALIQARDGGFYSTTYSGGVNGEGTVYRLALLPSITSFTPMSGPAGTTVTITGTNLGGATVVGFTDRHASSFTVNSTGTQITTTVPMGAVTGPIAVLTPGGEAKSSASFTVTAAAQKPTITSFSPTAGPVGTTVTITGTNLGGATVVGFTGRHASSFMVNGAGTQITTTVPNGAMTGAIAVLTSAGEAKSTTNFTVQ